MYASQNKEISPAFAALPVMGLFVQNGTICGAIIFGPHIFYVDQSPLAAAESKVLNAG